MTITEVGQHARRDARPRTCAHRGDSSRFRENTLPAVRSAIAEGADIVEIDVRVTSDGAVIVLHDPTLTRLWGIPGDVKDVALAEVEALGDADHRPPLLADVLPLFEGASSALLIDMDAPELAEPAYRVAAASAASVTWCGNLDGMRILRSLDETARIWMPWNSERLPTAADIAWLKPVCLNSDHRRVTAALVDRIHELGCTATAWTIDDEHRMRWARDVGVDTVTTNQLGRLRRVIAESAVSPADSSLRYY